MSSSNKCVDDDGAPDVFCPNCGIHLGPSSLTLGEIVSGSLLGTDPMALARKRQKISSSPFNVPTRRVEIQSTRKWHPGMEVYVLSNPHGWFEGVIARVDDKGLDGYSVTVHVKDLVTGEDVVPQEVKD